MPTFLKILQVTSSKFGSMAANSALSSEPQVAEVFETAEKMGLKVVRIWAFSDGDTWNALQPSIGRLDERVFRWIPMAPTFRTFDS